MNELFNIKTKAARQQANALVRNATVYKREVLEQLRETLAHRADNYRTV